MSIEDINDSGGMDLFVKQVQDELIGGEDSIIFSLGISYVYKDAPPNVHYSAPYDKIGRELWSAFEYELHQVLCDENTGQPQEWVEELINGNYRDLILGLASAVIARWDIGLGIAAPVVALIMKRGVVAFCREERVELPPRSVEDFISAKERATQARLQNKGAK